MTERGKWYSIGDVPQLNERGGDVYEHYLDIPVGSLTGKTVLNIGSGRSGLFEREAQQAGADVFTVSPYFTEDNPDAEEMREAYTRSSLKERVSNLFGKRKGSVTPVAARAEKLPFQDGKFDTVTALYSVPLYHNGTNEECTDLIAETGRILKDGGTATFYPVSQHDKFDLEESLPERGLSFKFTPVDEIYPPVYPDETPFRLTIQKPLP